MMTSRRMFLGTMGAAGAAWTLPGCCSWCGGKSVTGKTALQLYSIRHYIAGDKKLGTKGVGLAQGLKDVAKIGYKGVEFAGYYDNDAKTVKKLLEDNGLVACGTHVSRDAFSPEKFRETCDFNLTFGNSFICCPGGGNKPDGWGWRGGGKPSKKTDDFIKMLCDYYNTAAQNCAKYGCRVGLHNHMWEFDVKMTDGTTFWDYFFSHTDKAVQMEQDVGWTTCAGSDPCVQYVKYPHRSFTLHAKENGMGKNVTSFDAILGQPGKPDAAPVAWDALCRAADADGVEWWVVECERHCDDLSAVKPSYDFLKAKGRL